MGFFKKWSKHAFKVPKVIRKFQPGRLIVPTLIGAAKGGWAGAATGAAGGARNEIGRVRTDLANRPVASPGLELGAQRQAVGAPGTDTQTFAYGLPTGSQGAPTLSPTMRWALIGAGLLVVVLIASRGRR